MNADALDQAKERLSRAKRALLILKQKGERKDRESAWIDLITFLATAYSKLEQGAKDNGKSTAWFGKRKNERKNDPLLAYVHHARNSAEHGIASGGRYAMQAVSFTGVMKPGTMAGLRLSADGMKPFSTDPDLDLQFVQDDVHLLSVKDRGVIYHPPSEHLGSPLAEFGASNVAELAVVYVENMMAEAQTLVS